MAALALKSVRGFNGDRIKISLSRTAILSEKTKTWAKRAWGVLFYYGGIFHLIRLGNNLRGRRLTILMYHRVCNRNMASLEDSLPFLFVSETNFKKQLAFIKKRFHVIGFEDLDRYEKAGTLPRNSLIITFDDGYEDNYEVAYRILKQMGLKACFFIPSNRVGDEKGKAYWWDRAYSLSRRGTRMAANQKDSNPDTLSLLFQELGDHFFAELNTWDTQKIEENLDAAEGGKKGSAGAPSAENQLLSWSQIQEMSRDMEFGSHTCNHLNLITLPREQMEREIRESRMVIEEKTGKRVLAFSYPAGNGNEDAKRMVEKSGYKFSVSTLKGVNSIKETFHLRRINVWEKTAAGSNNRFCKGFFAYKLLGY